VHNAAVTGPESPFQPVPAGPPLAAQHGRTSGRVIGGFVVVLIGLVVPFMWLVALMLACDVQEDLERDPLLGPSGLNKATFIIAPIALVTSTVVLTLAG
jgi:hypothetical protein